MMNGTVNSDLIEDREKIKILTNDLNEMNVVEGKTLSDDLIKGIKVSEIPVINELNIRNDLTADEDELKVLSPMEEFNCSSSETNVKYERHSQVMDNVPVKCEENGRKESSLVNSSKKVSEAKLSTSSSVMPSSLLTKMKMMSKPSQVRCKPDVKHGRNDSVTKNISSGLNQRPLAKLLINMGLELVREEVIRNLIEIQTEKEKRQKLDTMEKSQLEKLEESLKNLVVKNKAYKVPVKRCKCKYVAFTEMTLELHRQYGGSTKLRQYRCCICMKFKTRNPPKFVSHMGREHRVLARLMSVPQMQCPFCPFEHRQSTLLDRHIGSCHKKFSLSQNLVVTQNVFDIPVFEMLQKPKVMPAPVQVMHASSYAGFPARANSSPLVTGVGDMMANVSTPMANPNPFTGLSVADILSACGLPQQIQAQVLTNLSLQSTSFGRSQNFPMPGFAPFPPLRSPILPQPSPTVANWFPFGDPSLSAIRNSIVHQRPELPLPGSLSAIRNSVNHQKQSHPLPTIAASGRGGNFSQQQKHMEQLHRGTAGVRSSASLMEKKVEQRGVLTRLDIPPMSLKCEICDLPSRDLESLRLHLVALHRESLDRDEFHKKGRTLNCSSCSEKFWTKQGALRHFLARHGPSEPHAYQCMRCGAKVATSILNHLSSQHNITVLDMYEAKFCLLCNTSFKTINQFESHVVDAHVDIFPNRLVLLTMIKALTAAYLYKTMSKPNVKPVRPLVQGLGSKPLPPKGSESSALRIERPNKTRPKGKFACHDCCINFVSAEDLAEHCQRDHSIKCSRCPERWNSIELLQRHFQAKHHNERDACLLCGELVQIGRPTVRHIKRMHIRACSVVVKRLHPKVTMRYLMKRRRPSSFDGRLENSLGIDAVLNISETNDKSDNSFETKVEEVMEVDGERIVIEKNE